MAMPPPEPQGAPESIKFGQFTGLKNTVDRDRLTPQELFAATNIDLDDTGKAHRRRGYRRVVEGNFHSLFNADDLTVYGVKDAQLCVINPDYSTVQLQSGILSDPRSGGFGLAYVQVGNEIFFSSAAGDRGIINHAACVVGPWGDPQDYWLSPVVLPSETLPATTGRLLGRPPTARFLAYYNGRIYLASGRTVWATELWLYKYVDKTRTFFNFEGEVTLLGTVTDGLYVGTTEGLYFLGGAGFPLKRMRVMDSPPIPGSMAYIPGELANPPQVGMQADTEMQVAISFMTTRGFCVGQDGGKAYNLTEGKFFFPVAARSAAMFRRQDGMNQYIAVNDSEGTPVNGARIGDFVEATIRRGGASWMEQRERAVVRDEFTPTWI